MFAWNKICSPTDKPSYAFLVVHTVGRVNSDADGTKTKAFVHHANDRCFCSGFVFLALNLLVNGNNFRALPLIFYFISSIFVWLALSDLLAQRLNDFSHVALAHKNPLAQSLTFFLPYILRHTGLLHQSPSLHCRKPNKGKTKSSYFSSTMDNPMTLAWASLICVEVSCYSLHFISVLCLQAVQCWVWDGDSVDSGWSRLSCLPQEDQWRLQVQ